MQLFSTYLSVRHFIYSNSLILTVTLLGKFSHAHFTDEKTASEEIKAFQIHKVLKLSGNVGNSVHDL